MHTHIQNTALAVFRLCACITRARVAARNASYSQPLNTADSDPQGQLADLGPEARRYAQAAQKLSEMNKSLQGELERQVKLTAEGLAEEQRERLSLIHSQARREVALLRDQLKSLQSQLKNATQTSQLTSAALKHEVAVAEAQEKHEKERERHEKRVRQLNDEHDRKIAAQIERRNHLLAAAQQEHERALAALQKQTKQLKGEEAAARLNTTLVKMQVEKAHIDEERVKSDMSKKIANALADKQKALKEHAERTAASLKAHAAHVALLHEQEQGRKKERQEQHQRDIEQDARAHRDRMAQEAERKLQVKTSEQREKTQEQDRKATLA